jgi:hypothetical protein
MRSSHPHRSAVFDPELRLKGAHGEARALPHQEGRKLLRSLRLSPGNKLEARLTPTDEEGMHCNPSRFPSLEGRG